MNLIKGSKLDFTDTVVAKQLIRSATSIGANIIEAQSSLSSKGFINSYRIALKSANESRFWLELLYNGKFTAEELDYLMSECSQLAKIIASIILKIR